MLPCTLFICYFVLLTLLLCLFYFVTLSPLFCYSVLLTLLLCLTYSVTLSYLLCYSVLLTLLLCLTYPVTLSYLLCYSVLLTLSISYDVSAYNVYPFTIFLISLSLLRASTGVRLLTSRPRISSRICVRTGSSSWKKES